LLNRKLKLDSKYNAAPHRAALLFFRSPRQHNPTETDTILAKSRHYPTQATIVTLQQNAQPQRETGEFLTTDCTEITDKKMNQKISSLIRVISG
jgi:hypothetical protein